nr:MAG TPA: hypothetical protein [Bacteriophage sp.]
MDKNIIIEITAAAIRAVRAGEYTRMAEGDMFMLRQERSEDFLRLWYVPAWNFVPETNVVPATFGQGIKFTDGELKEAELALVGRTHRPRLADNYKFFDIDYMDENWDKVFRALSRLFQDDLRYAVIG